MTIGQGTEESPRPNRLLAVAVFVALLSTTAILAFGAVRADPPDHSASDAAISQDPVLGHVHGLGVDPADEALYVASHLGVFRMAGDGPPERVADRWQDTMGFSVVGPGHFLASGHPDLTEDSPIHLGLIESRDAALTWQPLSLGGAADFHALEAIPGRTWGYDSQSGLLMTSTDNEIWQHIASDAFLDLAIDPANPDHVLATTADGQLRLYTSTGSHQLQVGPALALVDWPNEKLLVGVTVDGRVFRSADGGGAWERARADVPGTVEALDISPDGWYVATSEGIFSSANEGRKWLQLLAHPE